LTHCRHSIGQLNASRSQSQSNLPGVERVALLRYQPETRVASAVHIAERHNVPRDRRLTDAQKLQQLSLINAGSHGNDEEDGDGLHRDVWVPFAKQLNELEGLEQAPPVVFRVSVGSRHFAFPIGEDIAFFVSDPS
jgi:hypothetical protein